MANETAMIDLMVKGLLAELTDEQRKVYDAHMVKFNEFLGDVKTGVANEDPAAVLALTVASIEASKIAEAL